tara:strand:+ start:1815 stop:2018 length:204 start_codon:yes stop_codon:yes gene_type:complete
MEQSSLIPIISKDNNKIKYKKWVYDNIDNLKDIYSMIKNYDKEMNFLNECEFSIFCSFCYDKSNVLK